MTIIDEPTECTFCGFEAKDVKQYATRAEGYNGFINLCDLCAFAPIPSAMAEYPGNFHGDARNVVKTLMWTMNHLITTLKPPR